MQYVTKWRKIVALFALVFAVLFTLPNFVSEDVREKLPSWMSPFNLGLDLKGGAYLLLEVDTDQILKDKYSSLKSLLRREFLFEGERVTYSSLRVEDDGIYVRLKEQNLADAAEKQVRNVDRALTAEAAGALLHIFYDEEQKEIIEKEALERSITIIRERIDAAGTKEPSIQLQGGEYISVQLPGVKDPERIKNLIGRTAKMTFHKVNDEYPIADAMGGKIPADSMLLKVSGEERYELLYKSVALSGEYLADANPSYDLHGRPKLDLQFNSTGARLFARITEEYEGRRFAIVLDNKVLTAPRINEPITGGRAEITGNFTVKEAQNLALLLKSGALPAPIEIAEERSVGPELGADSIAAGAIASAIGAVLVLIFMAATYGILGVFADIVLVLNVSLILAFLSMLNATLTLPGIAGIVLTIGMAVDAAIIIYERLREEVRTDLSPLKAIESAFSRAFVTIMDSNITTFAAAVLLFQFGSGPIRGFAVTLGIGIITTVFSSVFILRLAVNMWAMKDKNRQIAI
jgi:preprotein translocase subunit SecD